MAESTNYQCPNCNGRMYFDGKLGLLQCEFCESTFTPQEVERIFAERQAKADAAARTEQSDGNTPDVGTPSEKTTSAAEASVSEAAKVHPKRSVSDDPIQAYLENAHWDDADTENLRAFNCSSCGAQLLVDQVTAVTSCPYCGNNAVVPGQLSDMLKPDYVIPFKLDKDDAIAALKEYYKDKKLLPKNFTEENHLEEIQGVYVPFWLYSGEALADYMLHGAISTTWSDSENMYTETEHYDLHRAGTMEFERIPVDGSSRMPDAHMDAIEPFDYSELTDFSVAYLPGYVTDRYDLNVQECDSRARKRAEETSAQTIMRTISGYEDVRVTSGESELAWSNIAYALLPVWMLHTKWNGNDYLFAMNGQTGRLIGDLPVDNGKMVRHFLAIFAIVCVVIVALVLFAFGGYTM